MMNEITQSIKTMSSREIAELCGKRHDNVMADIRNMCESLKIQSTEFSGDYKDDKGRTYPCFNLPKRETLILVSGYDIVTRAKIIDRWQELENQQPTIQAKRQPFNLGTVMRQCVMMAKACGLKDNQAILSADRAVKKITGESPLQLLDAIHLHAPVQQLVFTPTQIGQQLEPSISAVKVNVLLADLGLQIKIGENWTPTQKGMDYAEVMDTGKKHSDGTMVKQIKWFNSVIDLLNQHHKPHLQVV
jgi:hypothetical protein